MPIRRAGRDDAAAISRLIVAALRETNARDYPPAVIDRLVDAFAPARVAEMLDRRRVLVVVEQEILVGTASLEGTSARAVFVAPSAQGRGIGGQLMDEIERLARDDGIATLSLRPSITAEGFYRGRGYAVLKEEMRDGERTVMMEKTLGDAP